MELLDPVIDELSRLPGLRYRRYVEDEPRPGPRVTDVFSPRVASYLEKRGITRLFEHQYAAVEAHRSREDYVLVAGTGTGKTEAYWLPIIDEVARKPYLCAPFRYVAVYPTKALERDQLRRLEPLFREFGLGYAVLDGDTPERERRWIIESGPCVLITNLHELSLVLASSRFKKFFKNTARVVIDEVHWYRGSDSARLHWVSRRLRMMSRGVGFSAGTATIGNPREFVAGALGLRDIRVISGPSRWGKLWELLYEMNDSTVFYKAVDLLLREGLKGIVYIDSRQGAERLAYRLASSYPGLVAVHRAGYTASLRHEVEDAFREGRIRLLVATPTMEVGIDIGDLDFVAVLGLPSRIQYLQRIGRVGRRGRVGYALVFLSPRDAYSEYVLRYPDEWFSAEPEPRFVNPRVRSVLEEQALLMLSQKWYVRPPRPMTYVFRKLLEEGLVEEPEPGVFRPRDYRELWRRLGTIRDKYVVVADDGEVLGEASPERLFIDLYPGAIYWHGMRPYSVLYDPSSLRKGVIRVRRIGDRDYDTKPLKTTHISKIYRLERLVVDCCDRRVAVYWGYADIVTVLRGYAKCRGSHCDDYYYSEPITMGENVGFLVARLVNGFDISAYHAFEHALVINAQRILGLDEGEIGGIAYPGGYIVVHDSVGGLRYLVDNDAVGRLVATTIKYLRTIRDVTDPRTGKTYTPGLYTRFCGNANRQLSRRGAIKAFLSTLERGGRLPVYDEYLIGNDSGIV